MMLLGVSKDTTDFIFLLDCVFTGADYYFYFT